MFIKYRPINGLVFNYLVHLFCGFLVYVYFRKIVLTAALNPITLIHPVKGICPLKEYSSFKKH